jgi:hypothetical protein
MINEIYFNMTQTRESIQSILDKDPKRVAEIRNAVQITRSRIKGESARGGDREEVQADAGDAYIYFLGHSEFKPDQS